MRADDPVARQLLQSDPPAMSMSSWNISPGSSCRHGGLFGRSKAGAPGYASSPCRPIGYWNKSPRQTASPSAVPPDRLGRFARRSLPLKTCEPRAIWPLDDGHATLPAASPLADRACAAQVAIQDMRAGNNHRAGSLYVMVTSVALEQANGHHDGHKADDSDTRG
jgi:hypothetical protein